MIYFISSFFKEIKSQINPNRLYLGRLFSKLDKLINHPAGMILSVSWRSSEAKKRAILPGKIYDNLIGEKIQ